MIKCFKSPAAINKCRWVITTSWKNRLYPLFNSTLLDCLLPDHLPRLNRDFSWAGDASLWLKLTFAFVPSGSRACCVSSCVSLITYFGILTDVENYLVRTLSDEDCRNTAQRHGRNRSARFTSEVRHSQDCRSHWDHRMALTPHGSIVSATFIGAINSF